MAFSVKDFFSYLTSTSKNKNILYLVAVPDGGGGYLLRNITKEDIFKLDGHGIDFESTSAPAGVTAMLSIDGTTVLFFDEPNDIFKTVKGFEVQDVIGNPVAALNPDGSITIQGNGVGVEAKIFGSNIAGSGNFELSRRNSTYTPKLMGMTSSVQEIVPVTAGSAAIQHKATYNIVEFNPAGAVTSFDLELSDPATMDEGTIIVLNNISGNSITGITYTLNGATNGSLPTALNSGDVKKIYLGASDTWYEM